MRLFIENIYDNKNQLWTAIWIGGLILMWIWDILFLNAPALLKLELAFFNTFFIGFVVVAISLLLAWITAMLIHFSRQYVAGVFSYPLGFLINLIRSVPQILGILLGYVLITELLEDNNFDTLLIITIIAFNISLFVFLEISDLMLERINHFQKTDFYNAGRVSGISEFHLVNFDILYKNSWIHIFNKMISVFGMSVFLICSVDFIISVGLSTSVSAVNLPSTLGSMLAQIDSKQDILAVGTTILNPAYFPNLFFRHLQGISTAFSIVFSLFCIYKISNGYAWRHHL